MIEYACDNKKIEKALRHLVEKVRQHGGFIHDQVVLVSEKGDLSIRAPSSIESGESIIILPKEVLLPVEKFEIDIVDNQLVMKGHDDSLSEAQVEIMESVLEIYKLTDKFKSHRAVSTILNWKEGDLLFEHLRKGREKIPFLDELEERSSSAYLLNNFFKTRTLSFNDDIPRKTKKTAAASGPQNVLIPIADFLNHHSEAPQFQGDLRLLSDYDEKRNEFVQGESYKGVAAVKFCPIAGSDECFVYYSLKDALDSFFHYNFVERYAPYVRSLPVTVKLPNLGALEVATEKHIFLKRENLPEQISDLYFYVPPTAFDNDNNLIQFDYIYLPHPGAPRALRRVLNWAIKGMWSDLSEADRRDYVLLAEKQIIEANLVFYSELEDILKTYKPDRALKAVVENAKTLAQVQLEKIRSYPFFAATKK